MIRKVDEKVEYLDDNLHKVKEKLNEVIEYLNTLSTDKSKEA